MALELLNYVNVDLKWNSVKKGRRNTTRQPRKKPDISAFETNKIVDAPLKKRKVLSAGPQTPSVHYEDDPSQWYHSSSKSQSQKTKSKSRLRNKSILEKADFSGIKLLADAACSSLIYHKVNDQKVVKEETSPGVSSPCMDIKQVIISTESNGSPNQDTLVPDSSHNLHDDGNQKMAAPCSKELRLHWDLNTVMDDWEEEEEASNEQHKVNVKAPVIAVPLVERCDGDDDSLKKTCDEVIEDLGTKTIASSKTSDCESSVSKSDVVDEFEDLSTSTASALQEETVVKIEESISKSDEQPENKVKSEDDPTSECCGSNVTQDDKILAVNGGYDSPFEDGELREENDNESDNTNKNPLSEEVNHGQTMEDESLLTIPNTTTIVAQEEPSEIPRGQRNVEEIDCGAGKESSAGKNEPISDDLCRNAPYVPQSRSSSIGNSYPHSSMRIWDHHRPKSSTRNYGPRMGGDYRRPSLSERNHGYYYDNHRASNRYRYHSQDYLERKVRCSSPKRRSRSRSRSGSPIAWNFQKRKNSDVNVNVTHHIHNVSHEGLSKSFDERKFTDDTQFRRRVERVKSDDHIRFSQPSGRTSAYKYKDNGYARK